LRASSAMAAAAALATASAFSNTSIFTVASLAFRLLQVSAELVPHC
jgi:hypothetical protein